MNVPPATVASPWDQNFATVAMPGVGGATLTGSGTAPVCYKTTDNKYYLQPTPTSCPNVVSACPAGSGLSPVNMTLAQAIAARNAASTTAKLACEATGRTWAAPAPGECESCQPSTPTHALLYWGGIIALLVILFIIIGAAVRSSRARRVVVTRA